MNSEKFVVIKKGSVYTNAHCKFTGSLEEAQKYAATHNYGGGVEVIELGRRRK